MGITALILIAAGLSADAFAAAVCQGLKPRPHRCRRAALTAVFFGGFQALMPLIGWAIGSRFERYIIRFDHWIAFILLLIIGGKMVLEALAGHTEDECREERESVGETLLLAIATSIDALAVGITFSFLNVNIITASALIGAVTFTLSFVGCIIGSRFGAGLRRGAELSGGIILIAIGTKILLEHLGYIC